MSAVKRELHRNVLTKTKVRLDRPLNHGRAADAGLLTYTNEGAVAEAIFD